MKITLSELTRPLFDHSIARAFDGNHSHYNVTRHRDGDKLTTTHRAKTGENAWVTTLETIESIADAIALCAENGADCIDDIPQGVSTVL